MRQDLREKKEDAEDGRGYGENGNSCNGSSHRRSGCLNADHRCYKGNDDERKEPRDKKSFSIATGPGNFGKPAQDWDSGDGHSPEIEPYRPISRDQRLPCWRSRKARRHGLICDDRGHRGGDKKYLVRHRALD
jgi:hypothetical protein